MKQNYIKSTIFKFFAAWSQKKLNSLSLQRIGKLGLKSFNNEKKQLWGGFDGLRLFWKIMQEETTKFWFLDKQKLENQLSSFFYQNAHLSSNFKIIKTLIWTLALYM